MLISSALLAAIAVAGVGGLILWSNPNRWVNRTVFSCSVHIATWLMLLNVAIGASDGLKWLRCATAVSALIPLNFWLVKEAIASEHLEFRAPMFRRIIGWVICSAVLAVIPFTHWFIPAHSTGSHRVYGLGYYIYIAGVLGMYAGLGFDGLRRMKFLTGGSRLALQVWLGGGCATAVTILLLMAINALTHDPSYIRMQPLAVLIYYTGTTVAITTHRIFDARQLMLVGLEKILLVVSVALVAYALDFLFQSLFPEPIAFILTTALALWFAVTFSARLDRIFEFYPQATAARQAALEAGQRETRQDALEASFRTILQGWGHADRAIILFGTKEQLTGSGLEMAVDSEVVEAMRMLRWATPERLARERQTQQRVAVNEFIAKQRLGALVIVEGSTLTALVGVGVAASRLPFTYPQITQLIELASIMENAFERVHFSVKAQHAEQLATVGLLGASLAHEIRNPLVTIKTFVQLLPQHHQDPAFRAKFFTLIGDEVTRIDRLTEQLLDLASPRAYQAQPVDLHPVLRTSLELVAAKATDKRIQFLTDFKAAPDRTFTDGSAAKQVLLNLCFNAIQAVESREGERWVKVATRNVPGGVEMCVEDSGPGIAPEIRPRLFQPFQSTKSSGFGLGLAICSDILAGLDATIAVDPAEPGHGACFRVVFPCPA